MPHIIIEYSANIEQEMDLDALMEKLHVAAADSGVFPVGGIRTRCSRRDRYRITDGDPDNAFVHVVARIGHGRPVEVRTSVGQTLFDILTQHMDPVYQRRGLGLSFEVQEIAPETSFKKNNMHERLRERLKPQNS